MSFYRALADKSLFYFIRLVNKPPEDHYPITRHIHKPFCDFAQDTTKKRKGYGMPRDWLKSTCLTCWKAIWAYLQNPEERQLLAMENERIAMAKLHFISNQLLKNQTLRKLYWDRLKEIDESWIRKNRWSQTAIELPRQGIYSEASITVIGIGGAAQSGHYNRIYLDDIIGKAALDSELVMQSAFLWFDNVNELLLEPDRQKPNASEVNLIGSPWGPGDIYDYAKAKYPEYEWRITPCLKDDRLKNEGQTVWIQDVTAEHEESNWREQFPTHYYNEMRSNPEKEAIFWAQHMCNPLKASGLNKFDVEWLKYYKWDEREDGLYIVCLDDGEEFRLASIPLYGFIDPGGFAETKLMKKGSRNAILIGGQPKNSAKKFITYTHAAKFKKPSLFMREIFKAHALRRPRHWKIDTVGTQPYIFRDILEEKGRSASESPLIKEFPSARSITISPIPKQVGKDAKDSDIQALINPVCNGDVYIHINTMKEFKDEMGQYPHGFTVDLLDMAAQLNRLYWQRKPPEELRKLNKRITRQVVQRCPVSGY